MFSCEFCKILKSNFFIEHLLRLLLCINFNKRKFKNDPNQNNWKEHCSNPVPSMASEHFLQTIDKLFDKHTPCKISKSCSSFTFKSWKTAVIANSVKTRNNICKKTWYIQKEEPKIRGFRWDPTPVIQDPTCG